MKDALCSRLMLAFMILASILFVTLALNGGYETHAATKEVTIVSVDGSINVMTAELIGEAIKEASSYSRPVILLLDTPGGGVDITFRIIGAIERASVPVIGYVYPSGAKAWSAGTFILISTHIAAMAPYTIIGSAQPVAYDPLGGSQPIEDSKIINALVSYLVERARMHGRNETAAALFITENLNLSAEAAKAQNVVEVVASSIEELLDAVDGYNVTLANGAYMLQTAGARAVWWQPSLRVQILKFISEPIIAYLLFIVGLFALIYGVASPGYGGEVIGGICIVLGLIGLGLAGVALGGVILIVLGVVLLLAELLTPGFGLLGFGGVLCIILGGLLLFPSGPWAVSPEWLDALRLVVLVVPLLAGAFFLFAAYKVVKARAKPPFIEEIVGDVGEAVDDIPSGGTGFILYKGEYWKAMSEQPIAKGQRVRIVAKEGPILKVKPEGE